MNPNYPSAYGCVNDSHDNVNCMLANLPIVHMCAPCRKAFREIWMEDTKRDLEEFSEGVASAIVERIGDPRRHRIEKMRLVLELRPERTSQELSDMTSLDSDAEFLTTMAELENQLESGEEV